MNYYKVAIIGSPLEPLTYKSGALLEINSLVIAPLKNKPKNAVVIQKCEKPSFNCLELEQTDFIFFLHQTKLANFISSYYVSSLGEAFNLFTPSKICFPRSQAPAHSPRSQAPAWECVPKFTALNYVRIPKLELGNEGGRQELGNEGEGKLGSEALASPDKPQNSWLLGGTKVPLPKDFFSCCTFSQVWECVPKLRVLNDVRIPKLELGNEGKHNEGKHMGNEYLHDIKPISLSTTQKQAKEKIQKENQCLLFGDTGSGKTEIYISLMEDVLKSNKNAILLMPEISLTPQMEKRLKKHFGSLVGIWHSKITKKKKEELLENIYNGSIRILAGARSALFQPLGNIGLIIVDEEHDDSYKSSSSPRYNAKDMALMYGKILNAKVVLGSATPSVTSFYKLPTIRLKGTFYETQKTFVYENSQSEVSPFMLEQIANTLAQNKQVIVFVPTRANFKYLSCKSCGEIVKCPYCDIGMSLHREKNILKCHYCNFATKIPNTCGNCKGDILEANRIGTVQVAHELQEYFKDKNIGIFDRDHVSTQRKLKALLKEFNDKKIDILVGTQMLSKGHDYLDVGLSVILSLDNLLAQPDFKAREKTLALAIQIAGRSGRKGEGRVFMQTRNQEFFENYLQDYEQFLKDELISRKDLYPPYKKLLRILISHNHKNKCEEITYNLVDKINSLPLDIEIVGHGQSNLTKIANKYRYEILLRSNNSKPLIQASLFCKRQFVQIDMDPLSFT